MTRTWNYRLVRLKTEGEPDYLEVREVHYEDGEPVAMGSEGAVFGGDSVDEVRQLLAMALGDAGDRPVFDPPEAWTV